MTLRSRWMALACAAAILLAAVVWRLVSGGGASPEREVAPSALVTLAPVVASEVRDTVEAYGVVAGAAASTRTVAVARPVIVQKVLAQVGLPVAAGDPLMVIADAPSASQAYRQAADAAAFAERDLARVRRLSTDHLAASDQVSAAEKTLADARAALSTQVASGAGKSAQTVTAPFAGVVSALPVATGEHVAADAPLVVVAASRDLVAQLAVDPAKVAGLRVGQVASLAPVFRPERGVDSRLSFVGRTVDPTTRMIGVAAPFAGGVLGEAIRARITTASHPGLFVPAAAVAYDEAGAHVFVVAGGKAKLTPVTVGSEDGDAVAVAGALSPGERVAVAGAFQLQDGMAVRAAAR